MKFIDELKLNFIKSEGVFRLMLINIVIFLGIAAIKLVSFLAGAEFSFLHAIIDKLAFKSNFSSLFTQPWSLITYMFVHENFMHILFNMLILFWTGKIFCDFMSSSKVVAVYLLGGIFGALLYMISYNLFPVFADTVAFSKLIGASAGVIAVLVAIATLVPNFTVHLIIFGGVRLKFIALSLILLYIISIPDGNAGGNISHLGGALFGFLYTKSLQGGNNIGLWLENLLQSAMGWFQPSSKIKVVHRRSKSNDSSSKTKQEVIDSILEKISRSGYSSLTKNEKEILFNESNSKKQ